MTILVAAASKHGATDEIAARLGAMEKVAVRCAHASGRDYRHWQAIDDWAGAIAEQLTTS
jgi:menaquinone-dependent protoporphyrinogen IX oxidase